MASGGNRMPSKHYYSILGLSKDASLSSIRSAYRKLAMRWHPDKCTIEESTKAKIKFQEIQEAYAVLSDEKKKALYDCGLYNQEDDEEDIEGFGSFMNEMSGMMANVQAEGSGAGNSFEELQKIFVSMFSADLAAFGKNGFAPPNCATSEKKRGASNPSSFFDSRSVKDGYAQTQSHFLFSDAFGCGNDMKSTTPKKSKRNLHADPNTSTSNGMRINHTCSNQ